MNRRMSCPCSCRWRGSAPATSASPPVLASGATSEATKQIRIAPLSAACFFLLAHESLDALLEVCAQETLQRVAVEADQRFEQRRRKDRPAELFLVGDHLQQDQPRDVLVRLVFDHLHAHAGNHEIADVVERDVTALRGVVEPPVSVFLDDAFFAHTTGGYSSGR